MKEEPPSHIDLLKEEFTEIDFDKAFKVSFTIIWVIPKILTNITYLYHIHVSPFTGTLGNVFDKVDSSTILTISSIVLWSILLLAVWVPRGWFSSRNP